MRFTLIETTTRFLVFLLCPCNAFFFSSEMTPAFLVGKGDICCQF